jgi:hypothetical protein
MAPLVSDFNRDGFPDVFVVNLDGPSRGFLNTSTLNNSVTLRFANSLKNLNAKIELELEGGKKIFRELNTAEGLLSSQGNNMTIGVGNSKIIKKIQVTFLDKTNKTFENVKAGDILKI